MNPEKGMQRRLTVTAQSSRSQIESVHTALGATRARGRVELAVGVDGGVDRLLAGAHGVGENGVHVAIGGTVLKHRGPVNSGLTRRSAGHDRVFRVGKGLYLFNRTINTQLLAMGINTRVHEILILLGRSHPGGSRRLTSVRVVTRTAVHAVDGRHREPQGLLIRESGAASGHPVAIHGPIRKMRTHHAIGRDGITDFILNRLARVRRGGRSRLLRTLQMGLGMRQVGRARGVTTSDRALLEVALQDVTAGEGILAKNTHIGSVTGVYK